MTDFHGLPTRTLANRHLSLEYLAEAGPRIVRATLPGSSENLFAEVPDVKLPSALGECSLLGGHRLWTAPEATPRSYVPDNRGLVVEERPGRVGLLGPIDEATGIRKSIEIQLHADRPAATVLHRLTNQGLWPVELAPWGITMLPLGGIAILPQTVGPLDRSSLLPNRQLVLWPYASWRDARLQLADDVVVMRAEPALPPCKVGYLDRQGWLAYLRQGVLFAKRFAPRPDEPHVDFGCNAETYCGDRFLELESLGSLTRLAPGQSVEHVETWEFFPDVDVPPTLEGARSVVSEYFTE